MAAVREGGPPGARRRIAGRVVTLKLRGADFRIVTRRRTLPFAAQTARTLFPNPATCCAAKSAAAAGG